MNDSTGAGLDGHKGTSRIFPHIDDLTSVQPVVDINSPIRRILQEAELLAKQADTHLDFRRPDIALQEFIKASILATDIIPRHKDFPSMSGSQSELNRSYIGLLKRIKAQQGRFEEARRFIKEDNEKSGVLPLSSGGVNGHIQSTNGTTATSNGIPAQNHTNGAPNPLSGSTNGPIARKKPPIQPKPDALHGKALHPLNTTSSTPDQTDLASRFARLRTPVQDPRIRTQPISIPEQADYTTKSPTATNPVPYPTTVRPSGPREMPSVPTTAPRQTRLPLDVQVPGMPKPPAAIYSPSRNPDTAATINLPSSIPRSSSYIGNGNNTAPPVSTVGRTPSFDGQQEYFSSAHKMNDNTPPKPDLPLPDSTTVSANDLTKYLRVGSQKLRILLVDLRSREEFDDGHIMSPYIICIEPVTLRDGISSEELVESLVLSPDSEQRLYEQRHEFDLVVFYDQHSSSIKGYSRQASDTSYLQNFAKAMYEYGYDKQLKRRPMLLLGGLDAWADLMGQSSLQSSSTGTLSSKKSSGNAVKPARPLGRVPMAREPYRFPALRKRTYESRPLSKEEESKWDETLKEHPTTESPTAVEQDASDELSYVRTTEDFFRRYPELPSIQESMISARPAPQMATYRSQIINSIPEPPARPAPALPRQRSSGVLEKTPIAAYAMSSGVDKGISSPNPKCGLTGLQNSGVTCYALAIVQCLSATGPLREYLIHFTLGPTTAVPKKTSESTDPPQLLVRNFGNLLGHMWSGMYDFVAPVTFMVSLINCVVAVNYVLTNV
jgi:ubiquitin carboxyl-terminal hydrolase 8